jgi:hypothetical protein
VAFDTVRPTVSRPVIAGLLMLITIMMFRLSGGMLWDLGISYEGITGSPVSKIHPATYLTFFTFALLMVARRNPASFLALLVTRYPGALLFLISSVILGLYIVVDGRRGIAPIFDTYICAALLSIIASELDARDLRRVEKIIHVLFVINAVMGIVEHLIDHRFFPFRYEGELFEWDHRSTALMGHPLENASITGTYVAILLAGGGPSLPPLLRAGTLVLQLVAMVCFGGRSALVLVFATIAVVSVKYAWSLLRGRRVWLPALAAAAVAAPLLALAAGAIAAQGFFDLVLNRFVSSDGGSAASRLEMLELFDDLSWSDLLIGAPPGFLESMRFAHNPELGLENPIVRLVLYQGAIFTAFLIAGFIFLMHDIARRLRPGTALPIIYFALVINSYESIANKTILLGQFVLLMLSMFERRPAAERREAQQAAMLRPAAARV